jgi:POT family proton-dependent oligopeptide transporter
LGERVGWHWGFFAAGVGLTLGLFVYLFALRTLPADKVTQARAEKQPPKPLTSQDWRAIISLVLLFIPIFAFWLAFQQQAITIALWARDYTDRHIGSFLIPATWSQSIDPIMIFAFTPIIVGLWAYQARKRTEPTTVVKMAMGCILLALSFLLMAGVAYITGPHGHASWLWLIPFFTIYTFGELYVSPIGLALVARVAPVQVLSMMMGFWFLSIFVGNVLAGYAGSFWDQMDKTHFFLMIAVIPAVAAVVVWLFDRPLKSILEKGNGALQPGPDVASERTPAE